MEVNLGNYSWQEAANLVKSDPVIVVPVGAFEQHGKHLPLKVDQFLVGRVAEGAAKKAHKKDVKVYITPTIWTGYSPHHIDFPGTISIEIETLTNLIINVVESLIKNQFERILILNGHGGNSNIIKNVVQILRYKKNIYTSSANYWDFAMNEIKKWRLSEIGGINHACEMETSLMLSQEEKIVRKDKIEDNPLKRSNYTGLDLISGGQVSVAASFKELSNSGVIGSPSLANKERGDILFNKITDKVSDFFEEFYSWPKPLTGKK
tara:strand:- start:218 stop:1009 length:792 start_codon:yes stop_codon:yes gene_type:complete